MATTSAACRVRVTDSLAFHLSLLPLAQYGYFEIRIRAVPIVGYHTVLWMVGWDANRAGEIRIKLSHTHNLRSARKLLRVSRVGSVLRDIRRRLTDYYCRCRGSALSRQLFPNLTSMPAGFAVSRSGYIAHSLTVLCTGRPEHPQDLIVELVEIPLRSREKLCIDCIPCGLALQPSAVPPTFGQNVFPDSTSNGRHFAATSGTTGLPFSSRLDIVSARTDDELLCRHLLDQRLRLAGLAI